MLNGNVVSPEKINCNESVNSGEISVWVVSLANIAHCPPEIRREVVAYLMNESKDTKNLGDGKHFLNIVNKKWGISEKEACEILNKIPKAPRHSKVDDFLKKFDYQEQAKKAIKNRQYKEAAVYFEKYLEIGQPYHPDMKIYVDNCLTRQHGSQYDQPEKFRKWNEAYPGKFHSW